MAHIKKLVMQGFKSFAKKTEVVFDKDINVIIGPNGSGKSNVSDALCFVLGRLSIKSMRAAKAKNLIFMGSKYAKPAKEAVVDIVFDNSEGTFALDGDEVHLKRIVRRNGQSIYKINDETKTRTEVIEMLAQAGIDPHGFNLILQGQIQSIVRMHPEERRKIIEEVAGISIYEARKEKSLKELEKTDARLKEIGTILRERTSYMNNLEKEKAQAQKYKDLEKTVARAKASILSKKKDGKEKEVKGVVNSIEEKLNLKDKSSEKAQGVEAELSKINSRIEEINKQVQASSGLEQDTLREQIANLKAELEGLRVRKDNHESRQRDVETRIDEMGNSIPDLEKEVEELRKDAPGMAKKAESLKGKKEELRLLEEERKKAIGLKTRLEGLRERIKVEENRLGRFEGEEEILVGEIGSLSEGLNYKTFEECKARIVEYEKELEANRNRVKTIHEKEIENGKTQMILESEIKRVEGVKKKVEDMSTCPLCQSEISEKHKEHVCSKGDEKISNARTKLGEIVKSLVEIKKEREGLFSRIGEVESGIRAGREELGKHGAINDKKAALKRIVDERELVKEEISGFEESVKSLEAKVEGLAGLEEKYDAKMLEIEEVSSRTEEDVGTTLLYKEREIENVRNVIKRSEGDLGEIEQTLGEIGQTLDEKETKLDEKESQEKELNAKFEKLFEERDGLQGKVQEKNLGLSEVQSEVRQIEEQVNYLKIGKAKLDAELEALDIEFKEYESVELLPGTLQALEERLGKAQIALGQIGSINLRALEVYEQVREEYDRIRVKVETLEKEKTDIMSIIEEIDKKKKRTFMKTFKAMNELFTKNFMKLSSKGQAYLDIENPDDIFAGGINIVVKLAKGKYFDVTSLSGGEQTLVALSLLFAIQEHKPYHFYVFDEIDAALDKRNSERLAGLLEQYMKAGQYIVVTHNDAIITGSNLLYGVSMQDGVSKVLSMKVD